MQEAIGRYELPAAAFHYARVEGPVPLGSSKFAGEADLAEGTPWPYDHKGRPLAFLCQINFADVQEAQPIDELPKDGLAVFFYELSTDRNWYDFFQKSGLRCMYFPSGTTLVRTVQPAVPEDMHECTLHFWPFRSYPEGRSRALRRLNQEVQFTDEEWEKYDDWYYEYRARHYPKGDGTVHHVWGNSGNIQGDMTIFAELDRRGLDYDTFEKGDEALQAPVEEATKDWQLLLQVDSDEIASDTTWGGFGRLYYFIRQQDLASLDFSKVWLSLQGC